MSKIPQSMPVVKSKTKAELDKELDQLQREVSRELWLLDRIWTSRGTELSASRIPSVTPPDEEHRANPDQPPGQRPEVPGSTEEAKETGTKPASHSRKIMVGTPLQPLPMTKEQFSMFMQHVPGPAMIKDSDGRYVFVNEYFRQMFPNRRLLGATVHDLLPKDTTDSLAEADRQALKEQRPVESTDTLRVNSRNVTCLTIRFPILQPHDEPLLGVIGVDITERKEAEDQLRALASQLQQRTAELEKKNIALSEILGNIEAEKNSIKQRISTKMEQRILPTLRRLIDSTPPSMAVTVEMLEKEVLNFASLFMQIKQQGAANLTARELEVCRMIKHGLTTKEIAESLNLSRATVQKHREMIRRKLGVADSVEELQKFRDSE